MISLLLQTPKQEQPVRREIEEAWREWVMTMDNAHNHADYLIREQDLWSHLEACLTSARQVIQSALSLVGEVGFQPKRVLDVGCSIGFKALAIQERFPAADVMGIDPDERALAVARRLTNVDASTFARRPSYHQGVGEALPYDDGSIDLVLSTTVIEHVKNVDRCLHEVARVLRPGGFFYIEAPNYLWPFEPHLEISMPPLCPKPLLRLLAKLQGRGDRVPFIEHLQFVQPFWIERELRAAGLVWKNGFQVKLERVLSGDLAAVQNYYVLARLLKIFGSSKLVRRLCQAAVKVGIYPSLVYLARKPEARS